MLNLAQLKEGTTSFTCDRKNGTLKLNKLKIERQHSFVEYVFGGCEMSLTMAIDFTGSNGDPRSPGSLHYLDHRN